VHYQTLRTWGYDRIFSSALMTGAPKARAVATMIRSAGSL
jgi:hypothetical protein